MRSKLYKFIIPALLVALVTTGCDNDEIIPDKDVYPNYNRGFYLVNEGNYDWGNGSMLFYSYDSLKVYGDIFKEIAEKPLGDIPVRIVERSGRLYIIVNNSGKIEIIDTEDGTYKSNITGLTSPRDIAFINNDIALVTSLYSDSLTLINLNTLSVAGYINIGRSSEDIIVESDKIFVSNWSGGNTVTVLQKSNLELLKVIEVDIEPSEMVIDKSGNLRVICSGGYMNEEFPSIISIDTESLNIISRLSFHSKLDNPSELVINSTLDTLYYLNGDIFRMQYDAISIPQTPFIISSERNLYRLGFDQNEKLLVVTDAVDYVQKGYIYIYSTDGLEIAKQVAGIIPGKMSF